jgi:N-methylhydantoinase A
VVRAVSTELGRDLRSSSLIAFGGSGPIHAAGLAQTLGIPSVVVPPHSGVFSAFGLLMSPIERNFVRTVRLSTDVGDESTLLEQISKLHETATEELKAEGWDRDRLQFTTIADVRYRGQVGVIQIDVPSAERGALAKIMSDFQRAYLARYGLSQDDALVEVANIRLRASVSSAGVSIHRATKAVPELGTRSAYFGGARRAEVPVITRDALSAEFADGPLIVDEFDTSIVVPPRCRVRLLDEGNVHIKTSPDVR